MPERTQGINSNNSINRNHNISEFISSNGPFSPPPINKSHNRSRVVDDPHSKSIMVSPIQHHRGSVFNSPPPTRPSVMSPLNARRKTNHGQSITKNIVKNNFSLQREKIPKKKQRPSKILDKNIYREGFDGIIEKIKKYLFLLHPFS